jgi:hypothetical protein
MTKKELLAKLEALGPGIDDETRNGIVCALVGHSRIVDACFGQITCGRCGAIVGDTLAGCYDLENHTIIDHSCDECKANYKKMGWRDKLFIDKEKVFPPPEKRRLQLCRFERCAFAKKDEVCEYEKKEPGVGPRVPVITWCTREGGAKHRETS